MAVKHYRVSNTIWRRTTLRYTGPSYLVDDNIRVPTGILHAVLFDTTGICIVSPNTTFEHYQKWKLKSTIVNLKDFI